MECDLDMSDVYIDILRNKYFSTHRFADEDDFSEWLERFEENGNVDPDDNEEENFVTLCPRTGYSDIDGLSWRDFM